ncbi:uncharacterized protein LOC111085343 [Limulus polyphemus]|uniref:Uncharacterized protein LOC111085343 n=1 Tax=Limulus polyphemus TaxID=6850 RepID=A0ABM1S6F0_LIMPO|nr:uncharacterized protein LOC111085343 [Limulus polyphemus]
MTMLKWLLGVSLKEKRTDKGINEIEGICGIEEKGREARLKCLGHVKRREKGQVIRRALELSIASKRRQGRPLKCWKDEDMLEDMNEKGIAEDLTMNLDDSRRATRAKDSDLC